MPSAQIAFVVAAGGGLLLAIGWALWAREGHVRKRVMSQDEAAAVATRSRTRMGTSEAMHVSTFHGLATGTTYEGSFSLQGLIDQLRRGDIAGAIPKLLMMVGILVVTVAFPYGVAALLSPPGSWWPLGAALVFLAGTVSAAWPRGQLTNG